MTADEFFVLPDPPEGGKMELVCGRVVTMSPVGIEHGEIASSISDALRHFVRPRRLGRVGVEIGFRIRRNPDVVRAPDVSFLSTARRPAAPEARRRYFDGHPDLAVEVVSPDDTAEELAQKTAEYLAAGTPRIWVVQPVTRSVTVYYPGGDSHTFSENDTLSSHHAGFPEEGFALPVSEIFA